MPGPTSARPVVAGPACAGVHNGPSTTWAGSRTSRTHRHASRRSRCCTSGRPSPRSPAPEPEPPVRPRSIPAPCRLRPSRRRKFPRWSSRSRRASLHPWRRRPRPTAEEWAFASTYKLKNSKGYRYTWGQQVRSMMGTAVEGPDQGMVRFRVEIAPDGSWPGSTRCGPHRLLPSGWPARPSAACRNGLPRRPARPLIFEKTISFSPFASDGPPLYKDDCLPDPPAFSNPFAWDGKSARGAGPSRADRETGPPGTGGLPQATASGLDRGGECTRPAFDGPMGLGVQQIQSMSERGWSGRRHWRAPCRVAVSETGRLPTCGR
jgi:hypothetical protein